MTDRAMPLTELLHQIGAEFAGLAEEIQRLQDVVSGLLQGAGADHDVLERAQALDRVHQHAAELAKVVTRTAEQAPRHQSVALDKVLAGVSLSALAQRLSGDMQERPVSGEMELL